MLSSLNNSIRVLSVLLLLTTNNCTTVSNNHSSPRLKPARFADIKPFLFNINPDVKLFEKKGPFKYKLNKDFDIRVSKREVVNTDIYLSKHEGKAPLVIIQHGNLAHKGVHRNQARRLASWGLHAMIVSQPNRGRWYKNGKTLTKLTRLLAAWPELISNRFDPSKIIVVGHSFGGSAAAVSAAGESTVKGVIFLDPALVDAKIKHYLKNLSVPSILLGADKRVFKSRKRQTFHNLVKGRALEISVKNSTHNDAQSPNLFSFQQFIGIEHGTDKTKQSKFISALICSVMSLAFTEGTNYAWDAFQPAIEAGDFIGAKHK